MGILKNILFLILSITFSLIPISSRSQFSITGRTVNIVSDNSISPVNITHTNGSETTTSDSNGAFVLKIGEYNGLENYRILYNIFYSSNPEEIKLSVFNLNGAKMLETIPVPPNGTFLFPSIPKGLYILQVADNSDNETFKIYSTGESILLLGKGKDIYSKSAILYQDTLIFQKRGYYERRIPVPQHDTTLYVEMLNRDENDIDFLNGIPDYNIFSKLKGKPFVTNQSEVESVKFIYNINNDLVYFMNSTKYELHYPFAQAVLGYSYSLSHFNATQYTNSSSRYLYLGSINYYKNIGVYVIRFYPGDMMDCNMIKHVMDKINQVSFFDDELLFYINNLKWENCGNVPTITSEQLFEGQNYQALNLTENFGYLKKVDIQNIGEEYFGRHDIVLLNGIPNDIPVVAGIITTEFQTPLSHINVLSHNRGTPNMALRDGWINQKLEELTGELVYLNVLADSFEIRKASIGEAEAFWKINEPQREITLEKNLSVAGLVNLENEGFRSTKIIGGKAANFAEMMEIKSPSIPTPENPFAIPFYYYQQHITQNNLSDFIKNMLVDEDFKSNQLKRQDMLAELREKIKSAPIDPALVSLVEQKINHFSDWDTYRFRSSTNAEDLEFFSGAGLYDSYSAKKNNEKKTIADAIRKVWASLWNFRAFEEREFYNISHLSTAMGILCHRSFPDEDANGVVITKNLYNRNPGIIINVQYKEYSIVFPEPGVNHDQIIVYTYSLDPEKNFTIEYISHSNIPELGGKTVLTEDEIYELSEFCMILKAHYYSNVPNNCQCSFYDLGLDIEFKIDSPNGKRKLYIKQVRFY